MKTAIKLFIGLILLSSCGGSDSDSPEPNNGTNELGDFNLIFPDNNLVCTEGTDVGTSETAIEFLWSTAENATSYEIQITNQDSGNVINTSSTTTEKTVTLPKNTQFSWTVTAIFGDQSKKSEQWNFYSEGIAVENYAPFPANITVEDNNDNTVKISWTTEDLDNDLKNYDVYVGESNNMELLLESTEDTSINSYAITSGTEYTVKVISRDNNNNTSSSLKTFEY